MLILIHSKSASVLPQGAHPERNSMSSHPRILIVGGVAGGASAAARARRLSEVASIVLFERGPYVSFANCGLPYHIGGVIADRIISVIPPSRSIRPMDFFAPDAANGRSQCCNAMQPV